MQFLRVSVFDDEKCGEVYKTRGGVITPGHQAWLPDGNSQIFRIVCVWPSGLLDYGSATLRCKI